MGVAGVVFGVWYGSLETRFIQFRRLWHATQPNF